MISTDGARIQAGMSGSYGASHVANNHKEATTPRSALVPISSVLDPALLPAQRVSAVQQVKEEASRKRRGEGPPKDEFVVKRHPEAPTTVSATQPDPEKMTPIALLWTLYFDACLQPYSDQALKAFRSISMSDSCTPLLKLHAQLHIVEIACMRKTEISDPAIYQLLEEIQKTAASLVPDSEKSANRYERCRMVAKFWVAHLIYKERLGHLTPAETTKVQAILLLSEVLASKVILADLRLRAEGYLAALQKPAQADQ